MGRRLGPAAATTSQIIAAAQARARIAAGRCRPDDDTDRLLAVAAGQLLIDGREGPAVVAGYPWFGEWSRDTMTSYEGLVLETSRAGEGRLLLQRAAASLSEGMLANSTPGHLLTRAATTPAADGTATITLTADHLVTDELVTLTARSPGQACHATLPAGPGPPTLTCQPC